MSYLYDMNTIFNSVGIAYNIAQKARHKSKGREPVFKFKETEFKRFVHHLSHEQKCICSQQARNTMQPPASGKFAADIVEAAPDVEVF